MNRSRLFPSSRRAFLRGLGASVALPALSSLLPRGLSAAGTAALQRATTPTGAPLRTAFLTFPNGAFAANWWPSAPGALSALSPTLAPLAGLQDRFQIMGGLDQVNAMPRGDGGGDHARGSSVFLTGARINKSAVDVRAGVSIDQEIARAVGGATRLPSLEMTCDAGRNSGVCDSGYACAYQYNISWRDATTPMPPENNPRVIFERLFGAGEHGERQASAQARLNARRSVLDFVMEDTRRLDRRLDPVDRGKLDQYLTGLRDVERRVQQAERLGPNVDPDRATPAGIPEGYADYIDLMLDMLVLAFQTDSTRVATLILAHDGNNRSFPEIGISEGHHNVSHHKHREDFIRMVSEIERWYVARFAGFLRRLDAIEDVDGNSVLYNSRIVYGSGNADGNIHTHVNLPILLAGNGGGTLTPGRYTDFGSTPLCNLFLTLADQAGVTGLERFGDSSGRLPHV